VIVRATCLLIAAAAIATCSPAPHEFQGQRVPNAAECTAKAAFLDHRGMFGKVMCVTPFPDAGKACSDKSNCSGRCIIAYEKLGGIADPSHATGQCQADDAQFGCYSEIVGGKVTQPICVD
jgi:hypothetical protein